jgi:AraC-like DNA-binding protein
MEKQTYSIDNIADQILKQGLIVFENLSRLYIFEKPLASPCVVILLNHQGWLKAVFDMKSKTFYPHDLVIISPEHIIKVQESSDDYLTSLLVISPQFLKKLSNYHPNPHNHIEYHYDSAFHLNDEQYNSIIYYFRMLHAISQVDHPDREDLLAQQMDVGAKLIEIYLQENGFMATQEADANQQLLYRFQNAIAQHFRESREVQFYANLLCLSPKYFGSVIKQLTGITAIEWISRYVIIQAKSWLRYRHDFSIQQVSYELGFPDPAAFARYFKANTGLTPKEFREQRE